MQLTTASIAYLIGNMIDSRASVNVSSDSIGNDTGMRMVITMREEIISIVRSGL
jgi:hypothetical protein